MEKILVFAHMMKTAGTSLSKQLIAHFGRRMHIVPGGLKLQDDYYDLEKFEKDLLKLNNRLEMISGHPMRPYIDFGKYEKDMLWFTFFRDPRKRYVSHYLHDYKWTNHFSHNRYRSMNDTSIMEWEKVDKFSNYQTKFIAGEENLDKAIEIIEDKFEWVGLTEEYESGLASFKSHFGLSDFHYEIDVTNPNLADKELKIKIHNEHSEFIAEHNSIDVRLYDYIKKKIWPKYNGDTTETRGDVTGKGIVRRKVNTTLFHLNRQLKFNTSEINLKNIKRFYNRWYR